MKTKEHIKLFAGTDQQRRKLLGLLGSSTALSLSGSAFAQAPVTAGVPACVVVPRQTEGPYFIDDKLHRSDIRLDPDTNMVSEGLPLRVVLRVSQLNRGTCTPLSGAMVDFWQCDAVGKYSGVRDRLYDTRGHGYLRGYQLLDASGTVEFLTVYPGWYPTRTVHVHFKVRTDPAANRGLEFSSQLYFEDTITDEVHQGQPYASIGQRSMRNSDDRIYRRNRGEELLLKLSRDTKGYTGIFELALESA